MPFTNIVSFTLSEEELNEINSSLDTLERILTPKTISLNPELRRELPKMGDKSLGFVEKAIDLGEHHPEFLPQFVDLEEAKKDLDGVNTIRPVKRRIGFIFQRLEDTGIQAGSEAYSAGRGIYDQIKMLAKSVQSVEAQKARDELKARYLGKPVKSTEEETASA